MPHAAHKLEPDPSEIAPGRGIGHFVIQERIGRGGMGHVYKVRDKVLGRTLALKLLSPIHAMDSEQRERFDREIVTLARLNHPNVVPVYEAGAHEGCPFYVMELIEGEDLDRRVMRNGAFDEREAARIILQVAQGVSHMHERDVIHRDIKPANILLRKDGSAALTDFGLARGMKPERNLTQTGMAIGTPAYMSPEQAKGDVALIGPATDIYQLGATLYTLVTGLEPYKDVPAHKQMMAVVEGAGPAFGVGAVSAPLRAIIRKAMARNIRKRYLTVKAFADDIERFLAHEWVLARGRNPVGRALYWLRRYAAAVIVAAVGIVIITSVILVGLNDPGYGQEPRYGGKKTFRADAPAPELELLVHGATSTITTVGHTVTRDAAESQIEILAKPGTTAFGWGDYQAVVEVRDIEPAKAVVHCFVGGAPDTPQSGLRVTVGRGRFAVTDKGYELVNLPVDDGEGALRLTLNRRAESIELTLVRGNVTAGQAVLRDHFRPAANECAQGFGIVSEASRLTLGEVSYQQLPEQGSRIHLLMVSGAWSEALMRIDALLDNGSGGDDLKFARGICLLRLAEASPDDDQARKYCGDAVAAFDETSASANDTGFHAMLMLLDAQVLRRMRGWSDTVLAPSQLRALFGATRGDDGRRAEVVCALREAMVRFSLAAGFEKDVRDLARITVEESQWEPSLCLRAYEDLLNNSPPEQHMEILEEMAGRPSLRHEPLRCALLLAPLVDQAARGDAGASAHNGWANAVELATHILEEWTVPEDWLLTGNELRALTSIESVPYIEAIARGSEDAGRYYVSLSANIDSLVARHPEIAEWQSWLDAVHNALFAEEAPDGIAACKAGELISLREGVPGALRGHVDGQVWRAIFTARSYHLEGNHEDARKAWKSLGARTDILPWARDLARRMEFSIETR